MNNKWKILAGILAAIVVAGVVYMGTQNTTNTVSSSSIAASETPVPTETPTPTDEPEAEETLEFDFDISVETYKVTQGVTEEELLADQAKKEGMFEWFYDGAVNYAQALLDKDNGCENVFLDEYIQWAGDKAKAEMGENGETTQPETGTEEDADVGEIIHNPDGTITVTGDLGMESYTDEEAAENKKQNYELGQEIAEVITSGEADKMLQEVLDRLAQEGYQP